MLDVSEVFHGLEMEYDQSFDGLFFDLSNMTEMKMVIDNHRPSYPSTKLTFTETNLINDKIVKYFNIFIDLNEKYDVDVVLQDSKRNLMNSLKNSKYKKKYYQIVFLWSSIDISVLQRECYTVTR